MPSLSPLSSGVPETEIRMLFRSQALTSAQSPSPKTSSGVNQATRDEYDKCKWDITTLMMKDGEFSDTYMFGDYSVIFDSGEGMTLADVMIFADGKMILYAPDMRKLDGVTKAPYDITVPDGTKKLELYGLIRGSKAGKLTMEKGE